MIARRIRELNVYSEIRAYNIPVSEIKRMNPEGIILSGGPANLSEDTELRVSRDVFNLGIPVLGLCYGPQLMAFLLGGSVKAGAFKEYGATPLKIKNKKGIFSGLKDKEIVWMSHGDLVEKMPRGFVSIASTKAGKNAAMADFERKLFGLQFHPEVEHTKCGIKILNNFLKICNAKRDWKVKDLSKILINEIREKVKKDAVIMGVSGGVDSLVAATLIRKATPNVHCVFIDHGLVREGEADFVKAMFKKLHFKKFHFEDASELFLSRLKDVEEPEEKRKIIGKTFIEVFEKTAEELKHKHKIKFLGQGTIYPDRIESAQASKKASVIKTHHNVGGLPEKMKFSLVEPLKDLYKDEVRELGKQLKIPAEYLNRHPFPGPGLAIRIIGKIDAERLALLRKADRIFIDELVKSGYYNKTWQALAALLPIKAVGVMGDSRSYGYIVSLRAVTSKDAMTADWARLPDWLLEKVSNRIMNEVRGITRVVYDISQKPPATIEYE